MACSAARDTTRVHGAIEQEKLNSQDPPIYGPVAWSYVRTFMVFSFVGLLETALLLLVAPLSQSAHAPTIAAFTLGIWSALCPTCFFWHRTATDGQVALNEPVAYVLAAMVPLAGILGAVLVLLNVPREHVQLLFLISWVVIPPAWFVYESYEFHPRHGTGSFEQYREGRAAAAKLWVAGAALTTFVIARGWPPLAVSSTDVAASSTSTPTSASSR